MITLLHSFFFFKKKTFFLIEPCIGQFKNSIKYYKSLIIIIIIIIAFERQEQLQLGREHL